MSVWETALQSHPHFFDKRDPPAKGGRETFVHSLLPFSDDLRVESSFKFSFVSMNDEAQAPSDLQEDVFSFIEVALGKGWIRVKD